MMTYQKPSGLCSYCGFAGLHKCQVKVEVIYFPKKCACCKSTLVRTQKMWNSFWECTNDLCPTNREYHEEDDDGAKYNGCGAGGNCFR